MLRTPFFVLALVATVSLCAPAKEKETYPDTYDYINIDEIVANDRLREQYYDCFLSKGPCVTADAKFFNEFLPETIATQCSKCTKRQQEMFDQLTVWYDENQPEKWKILIAHLLEVAKKQKAERGS